MNIAVIGAGYVGLVTGGCLAEFGLKVTCVDKDQQRIAELSDGEIPIFEPGLEEIVRRNLGTGFLKFTTDIDAAVKHSLVVFIAVGTPPGPDGSADLSSVDEVAKAVARNLTGYKVIVTKSTVPVGTGDRIRKTIEDTITADQLSAQDVEAPVFLQDGPQGSPYFDVVSNPEFLREGSAVDDFLHPDRIVIGSESEHAVAIMRDIYSPLFLGGKTPFVLTDIRTSELIKYATNTFLATKISFINEIANLCDLLGCNVTRVAHALGMDGRVSPKFLNPGPGFGGSCFPKDTKALYKIAEQAGYEFNLAGAVLRVNERQRNLMVEKITKATDGLPGKTIGILGLSFKPNTDDIRESPSIAIAAELKRLGANIKAHDPVAGPAAKALLQDIEICNDIESAARGTHGLVIATEWNQFRNLDLPKLKNIVKTPLLIDLRNIYQPQRVRAEGWHYVGLGRS